MIIQDYEVISPESNVFSWHEILADFHLTGLPISTWKHIVSWTVFSSQIPTAFHWFMIWYPKINKIIHR